MLGLLLTSKFKNNKVNKEQLFFFFTNMRKILSQEEKDKKTKRNQLIIGMILIGLMLLSTAGYAFINDEETTSEKIEYHGIEFQKDNSGYWNFNMQGQNFMTFYNPQETESINFFSQSSLQNYADKPLYFESEFIEPNTEISRNLNSFVLRFNKACLSNNCSDNSPVKNCSLDNVIIIKDLDENNKLENIYQQENCVFITASAENQTRYADIFLFRILGI